MPFTNMSLHPPFRPTPTLPLPLPLPLPIHTSTAHYPHSMQDIELGPRAPTPSPPAPQSRIRTLLRKRTVRMALLTAVLLVCAFVLVVAAMAVHRRREEGRALGGRDLGALVVRKFRFKFPKLHSRPKPGSGCQREQGGC